MSYPPDIRNQVDGTRKQRFIASWFDEFSNWLEYSIEKDAAYCLYCFLFTAGYSERGHDTFVFEGLAFRANDESENSLNQGNFLELLKVLASCNEEINNVVLKNAPNNLRLTSPDIQKDIINAAATETTKVIITDLRDDFFSILVDECRDVSIKEQMGVVISYVNGSGCVIERFIGLVHVHSTSAASLKKDIEFLFSTYGLSISSLRGQGYDGASNMRGEFNGLKSLILKENSSAYYIHCFAYQLQFILVAIAKKHSSISSFFSTVTRLVNVIGGSCKCRDML
ncbi:uncharacterized protein LOC110644696 [Hevea brasiliensis]|uniref:uncharacterized protein LOC110644696 n=1 Tax=Hevea brasiliensis TaxID=3981 RepID=UPI0025F675A5|nr:uncharacterized protein LOC110644696 [Hevea brasiliensis]